MQINAIMRNHYILIRLAKIWDTDKSKCWKECAATGTFKHCCWEYKEVQPFWKIPCQFLIKLNVLLSYNPTITLPGIYSNELKTYVPTKNLHRNLYCSFIHNWLNLEGTKVLFSSYTDKYTVIYPDHGILLSPKNMSSQAMERYEINLNACGSVKEATLKRHHGIISTIWHSRKGKTMEIIKWYMVTRDWCLKVKDEWAEHKEYLGQYILQ